MKDIVIVGAGEGEIVKLIDDINAEKKEWNIIGFLDANPELWGKELLGYPVLGGDDLAEKYSYAYFAINVSATPEIRRRVFQKYKNSKIATLIHPSVNVDYVEIGEGSVVYQGAVLGERVRLGVGVFLNYSVTVCHESVIGSYSILAPGVIIAGRVNVGENVFIGLGAHIRDGIKLGNYSVIGMGSVVVKDVPDGVTVVGNPAKPQ